MSDFRVLAVCRANYCRSPITEVILQAAADAVVGPGGWAVSSAGIDVRFSADMHPLAREVLADRGYQPGHHQTHQVDGADLADADLILTSSRAHRAAVVTRSPAAIGRTFTLLQFARLADLVDPIDASDAQQSGLALIREAKLARADVLHGGPELDNLVDPMGRPRPAFEACADTVRDAIDRILRPLQP